MRYSHSHKAAASATRWVNNPVLWKRALLQAASSHAPTWLSTPVKNTRLRGETESKLVRVTPRDHTASQPDSIPTSTEAWTLTAHACYTPDVGFLFDYENALPECRDMNKYGITLSVCGLYSIGDYKWMSMENWWVIRENQSIWMKTCSSAPSSTTNPTYTGLGLKWGLRGECLTSIHLSHINM
jgi:hypothetical protein